MSAARWWIENRQQVPLVANRPRAVGQPLYRAAAQAQRWRQSLAAFCLLGTASCASLSGLNAFAPSDDVKLGTQAYQEVLASEPILTAGKEVEQVKRVTDRLVLAVKDLQPELGNLFEWEVRVIDNKDTANAFCLPGGKMAVYTGILPVAKNDAGLAVVMGHEIAHATERHGTAAMTRQIGLSVLIEYALNGPVTKNLAGIGMQLTQLQFGQSAELEADREGLFYAARAGYDPREAVAFWKRMQAASGNRETSFLEDFLATHPSNSERIAQLEQLMPEALRIFAESGGGPTQQTEKKGLSPPPKAKGD